MYAAAAAIVTECRPKQGLTMRAASSRSALTLLPFELTHPFSAVQAITQLRRQRQHHHSYAREADTVISD
jgi:hypothetical protein